MTVKHGDSSVNPQGWSFDVHTGIPGKSGVRIDTTSVPTEEPKPPCLGLLPDKILFDRRLSHKNIYVLISLLRMSDGHRTIRVNVVKELQVLARCTSTSADQALKDLALAGHISVRRVKGEDNIRYVDFKWIEDPSYLDRLPGPDDRLPSKRPPTLDLWARLEGESGDRPFCSGSEDQMAEWIENGRMLDPKRSLGAALRNLAKDGAIAPVKIEGKPQALIGVLMLRRYTSGTPLCDSPEKIREACEELRKQWAASHGRDEGELPAVAVGNWRGSGISWETVLAASAEETGVEA